MGLPNLVKNESAQINFDQSDIDIFRDIVTQIKNKIYKNINLLPVLLKSLRATPFCSNAAILLYRDLLNYCQSGFEVNSADAFYIAGFLCVKGFEELNPPIKQSLAADYLGKAVAQNHVYAIHYLGYMHHHGIGCPKNINQAIYYYKQAIEKDCEFSMNNLALIYLHGEAGVMDVSLPLELLERAVKLGSASSISNLGWFYLRTDHPQKIQFAIGFLDRAIESLEVQAMSQRASLYRQGIGGKVNLDAARLLYLRAAELGHVPSMVNLALMLYQTKDNRISPHHKVIELLDCAIEQNSSVAMTYRAYFHEIGYGLRLKNDAEVDQLYKKAIKMGNTLAMYYLAKRLSGQNKEEYRAARLVRKAHSDTRIKANFDFFFKSNVLVYQYHAAICKKDFRSALCIIRSKPGLWSEFFEMDLYNLSMDHECLKLRHYCMAEQLKSLIKIKTFTDVFEPSFNIGELELMGIIRCLEQEESFIAQLICGMLLDGRILNEAGEKSNLEEYIEIRKQDAVRFYLKALDKVKENESESEFVKTILWEMKEFCEYPSVQTFLESLDIIPKHFIAGCKKFNGNINIKLRSSLSIFAFTPVIGQNGQKSIAMVEQVLSLL